MKEHLESLAKNSKVEEKIPKNAEIAVRLM